MNHDENTLKGVESLRKRIVLSRNAVYQAYASSSNSNFMQVHHFFDELSLLTYGRISYVIYKEVVSKVGKPEGKKGLAKRYYNFVRDPVLESHCLDMLDQIEDDSQCVEISKLFHILGDEEPSETSNITKYFLLPLKFGVDKSEDTYIPIFEDEDFEDEFLKYLKVCIASFLEKGNHGVSFISPVMKYLDMLGEGEANKKINQNKLEISGYPQDYSNLSEEDKKKYEQYKDIIFSRAAGEDPLVLHSMYTAYQSREGILSSSRWNKATHPKLKETNANIFFYVRDYHDKEYKRFEISRENRNRNVESKPYYDYSVRNILLPPLLEKYKNVFSIVREKLLNPTNDFLIYGEWLGKGHPYRELAKSLQLAFSKKLKKKQGVDEIIRIMSSPFGNKRRSFADKVFMKGLTSICYPYYDNAGLHRVHSDKEIPSYDEILSQEGQEGQDDYLKVVAFYYLWHELLPPIDESKDKYESIKELAIMAIPIESGAATWMVLGHAFRLPLKDVHKEYDNYLHLFDFHEAVVLPLCSKIRTEMKDLYLTMVQEVYANIFDLVFEKLGQGEPVVIGDYFGEQLSKSLNLLSRVLPFKVIMTKVGEDKVNTTEKAYTTQITDTCYILWSVEESANPYFPVLTSDVDISIDEVVKYINREHNYLISKYSYY